MANPPPGEATLVEVGVSYLDEIYPYLSYDIKIPLIRAMSCYLAKENTYEQAQQVFFSLIGRSEPLDRLKEIVDIDEEPLPCTEPADSDDSNGARKKSRPWTTIEDTRLLAGIYRFGLDNWTSISLFIGNGRTRAQSCQRWGRGLNPRISKDIWSYEEDVKLVRLVNTYGDKSWTKIAFMMGNRSDVQCRYHYHQVIKDMPVLLSVKATSPMADSDYRRMAPIPRMHGRNSMPSIPVAGFPQDAVAGEFVPELANMRPTYSQPMITPVPLRRVPPLPGSYRRPSPVPLPDSVRYRSATPEEGALGAFRRQRSNSGANSLDLFLKNFEQKKP